MLWRLRQFYCSYVRLVQRHNQSGSTYTIVTPKNLIRSIYDLDRNHRYKQCIKSALNAVYFMNTKVLNSPQFSTSGSRPI